MTTTGTCERCNGSGKLRYSYDHLDENGEVTGFTSGTRACLCVRDLPPVEGRASWWESEVVWERVWNDGIDRDSVVEMVVRAEVPRNEAGRRVVMRGNRYYPTWLTVDFPQSAMLHPEQAEDLALALLAGAAACRAVDDPDSDVCGHWAPCDYCSEGVTDVSRSSETSRSRAK